MNNAVPSFFYFFLFLDSGVSGLNLTNIVIEYQVSRAGVTVLTKVGEGRGG